MRETFWMRQTYIQLMENLNKKRMGRDVMYNLHIDSVVQRIHYLRAGGGPHVGSHYAENEAGRRQRWREWMVKMIIALSNMIDEKMDAAMETLSSPGCWENTISNLAKLRPLETMCSVRG